MKAPDDARPPYRIIKVMPAFWDFWRRAENKPAAEQLGLFRSVVEARYPAAFTANVVGRDPSQRDAFSLDAALSAYLPTLPERIGVMRRLSENLEDRLERFDASFRATFPDMAWDGTVYFTTSLDAFDGAIRQVGKKRALLFGLDKIAKLYGAEADLQPLFHHELFHVYQDSVNPLPDMSGEGPYGLIEPLWREGLAVYVARRLNPNATWKQLVLSEEMVRRGTKMLPQLATELRGQLKATTEETYRDFFLGAGQRADIPKRSAYFVGLKIAENLARDRSLQDLARLSGQELFDEVDRALAELASGAT